MQNQDTKKAQMQEQVKENIEGQMEEDPMRKRLVLIPISHGFEEIETISLVDILRRGGAKVILARADEIKGEDLTVEGTNGIKVVCDCMMTDEVLTREYDMITITGGTPNLQYLKKCERLIKRLREQKQNGKWLSAICGAPCEVLEFNGLLEGEQATCHFSCAGMMKDTSRIQERVVVSHNIITSQGPGTAVDFGLVLLEKLYDLKKSQEVAESIVATNQPTSSQNHDTQKTSKKQESMEKQQLLYL